MLTIGRPTKARGPRGLSADDAPHLDASLGCNDHVGSEDQVSQGSAQANRLMSTILDARLDDQQIKIAVPTSIAARVRADQDDARLRRGLQQLDL